MAKGPMTGSFGGRRKVRNMLIAPTQQIRTAILIFGVGFSMISLLFGALIHRATQIIQALAAMVPNSPEVIGVTANVPILLWSTYFILLLAFTCTAMLLSLVITHRYLGPAVQMRKHVQKLIEGDYSGRIKLRTNDQLNELADEINRLTEKLAEKSPNA